jgi:hypothetical protein
MAVPVSVMVAQITADSVVTELAKLAFSNIFDLVTVRSDGSVFVDLSRVPRDRVAALHEVTIDEYTEDAGEEAQGQTDPNLALQQARRSRQLGPPPRHVRRGLKDVVDSEPTSFSSKASMGFGDDASARPQKYAAPVGSAKSLQRNGRCASQQIIRR